MKYTAWSWPAQNCYSTSKPQSHGRAHRRGGSQPSPARWALIFAYRLMWRQSRMIKAIIWDFGGVITTSPFEAFNRYEEAHQVPRDFIRGINATNPKTNAWAQLERSLISIEAFDRAFEAESAAAGHAIPGRDVLALLSGAVRPRMVAAIKHCKPHFKLACLTNNMKMDDPVEDTGDETQADPLMPQQLDRHLDILALFDEVIESRLEGVRKPDPEMYRIALARLGVAAEACVFLDDLGINLKPAREMGMHTIKVLAVDQALAALAECTGLSFD